MSGILKRIAAIGRAILGTGAGPKQQPSKPITASGAETAPSETFARPTIVTSSRACAVPLKVTVSKPEPLSAIDPDHVPYAPHDNAVSRAIETSTAAETSTATSRSPSVLRCHRHAVSPIAAAKAFGRSFATTPRRAKPAAIAPVRVNRISSDSVRMQAALMRHQRQRDAERALARMKAIRPSATIHTLHRAA